MHTKKKRLDTRYSAQSKQFLRQRRLRSPSFLGKILGTKAGFYGNDKSAWIANRRVGGKIVDVEPLHDLSLICMRGEHMLRPFAIGSRGTIDGFSLVVCNEN